MVIEPIPYPAVESDPLSCLSGARYLDECRYVTSPGPLPAEKIYRSIAAADDEVWSMDIDQLVCPYLPICDPMVGGMVVKHDESHLTATYARSLSREFESYLVSSRVVT